MENNKSEAEKKKENANKEFSSVIDATAEFLKKIFPHTYSLISKLLRSNKEKSKKTE